MKKFSNLNIILPIILCMCFEHNMMAQQGQTGVGIRLGTDPGLTVKHFVAETRAIEGILHTGHRGLLLTGLYEWHKGVSTSEATGRLKLYAGLGGHFGVFGRTTYYYRHHHHPYYYHDYKHDHDVIYVYNRPSVGIDGIAGIEYDFSEIPLNLGLDFKPGIDFGAGYVYSYLDGALSVRVLF